MTLDSGFARPAAQCVADATRHVMSEHRIGSIPEEEGLNNAFVSEANRRFREGCAGVRGWHAQVLKRREEATYDADIMVVFSWQDEERERSKAILLQAKRGDRLPAEWRHLQHQCRGMLEHTSSAFALVWDYPPYAIPAERVLTQSASPKSAHPRLEIRGFFEQFFKCWLGDHELPNRLVEGDVVPRWVVLMSSGDTGARFGMVDGFGPQG